MGHVSLANQGYNALQILKYYYGNNLELVESNNIQDIPQSYPGSPCGWALPATRCGPSSVS